MLFQRILSQPVNRLLVLVMVVTALLPISLLAVHLNKTAWDNGWREIREKHQLLAENLTSPIEIYVDDHFAALSLLSETIKPVIAKPEQLTSVLNVTVDKLKGFASMAYVDAQGKILAYKIADDVAAGNKPVSPYIFTTERCFLFVRQTDEQYISGIKPSPFNLKPTIIMGMPVFNVRGQLMGVLLAELRVSLIEKLRKQIKFGKRGHSAIVDQNGRVIAHPNPEWMVEMRDLSSWPIVQAMMAGKQGVTEFYSSFVKQDMVAGYASVSGTGWGIMVPQPKSEVAAQVNQFMYSNYLWGGLGLIVAIIIGVLVSGWITRPINRLAEASQQLLDNDLNGDIDYPQDYEPREAKQLGFAMKSLVRGLQHTKHEVAELNRNLQHRVNDATKKLRVANSKLQETVKSDFLTSLVNRRYFEMDLSDTLSHSEERSEHLSILLFDIDNFKTINDTYGHAAGDEVLTHVARKLEQFMRTGDVAARYAGDEFVLRLHCDPRVAMSRANQIRQAIEELHITWRNTRLQVTVSIGIYSEVLSSDLDVRNILRKVDIAMYEAKKRGRNCVKTFSHEMATVHQLM
ncbi:diguanylate cyclase/phosphodiesterase (GGDEF & EAL domains) with PAS/PAC sensor(s) [hydrothermal vent metagenome]|uniref:Diguanylate cyclase/phosphodiesterase (GGDEF & EAL domains) with PAS/PAC sensor(S) n=1 Tax=hydrothermal vent metagenome TaxID=652676 RepID=A0A3B0ZG16_9ZZZZ